MSLTIKQEIMLLKNPSYYQINEVLKEKKAEILLDYPGEEAFKTSSAFFFALTTMAAIFLCVFGFTSYPFMHPDKILQIAGCSLLSIVALGVPFVIFIHKKLKKQTATPEAINAYYSRYDAMLDWRMKNNAQMIQFHKEKIEIAEASRAKCGYQDKSVQQ